MFLQIYIEYLMYISPNQFPNILLQDPLMYQKDIGIWMFQQNFHKLHLRRKDMLGTHLCQCKLVVRVKVEILVDIYTLVRHFAQNIVHSESKSRYHMDLKVIFNKLIMGYISPRI